MAYWGFVNTYGIDTTDNDGNKIGYLVRFESLAERKEWFNAGNGLRDIWRWCLWRECLSSKQARSIMEHDYRRAAYPEDVRLGVYTMSEFVRLLSMDQLWDWYNDPSKW